MKQQICQGLEVVSNWPVVKQCRFSGQDFHVDHPDRVRDVLESKVPEAEAINEFFLHLCVCHSVIPQPGNNLSLLQCLPYFVFSSIK